MSEKCDFCIGGKCVDSADEVPCGWAKEERWSECECATFGTFDEDEAVEVGKMNREEGLSVLLMQTGPAGDQTAEDAGVRMCDFYRNGLCNDECGLIPCGFEGKYDECPEYMPKDPYDEDELAEPVETTSIGPDGTGELLEGDYEGRPYAEEVPDVEEVEPYGDLTVVMIRVDLIDPHPDNPRKSELDVEELAASIKAEGIQQPLTVVPHVGGAEGRYTCVVGHRRLAAAVQAGLATVPAFIRAMDRREQLRTMMTENTQRRDLTPLEQADGFKQLMLELPEQTVAAVARETGFSETTVRRRLKLHELPREAVEEAERRNVSLGDYEKLNEIRDPERKAEALEVLGTADFTATLSRIKGEERRERELERLTEVLERKGATRLEPQNVTERADLELDRCIYYWQLEGAGIGGLDNRECWHYTASMTEGIRIYKVKKPAVEPENEPEKTDAELACEELKAKADNMKEDLRALLTEQEAVDQELLDRRTEFVEGILFQRHREEIMEAAALLLIRGCWWSDDGLKELGNWLGLEDLKNTSNETLMSLIRGNPEKALLYTLYVKAERDAPGWHTTEYFRNERYRKYNQQPKQELLYDILRVLGYQKSGEEMLMQGGAHHLQGNAQKIIEQFKTDERELKKRINV